MKTTWLTDKKSSACYYINLARQVQRGFFQNIRAIILPETHPDAWSLPDYGLFDSLEFITRLEATKDIVTLNVQDQHLIQMVIEKLGDFPKAEDVIKSRGELEKILPEIEPYFQQIFRHFNDIKEVQFLLTSFGAGSSYFPCKDKDGKYVITITFREDIGYQAAIKSIVSCMVYIEQEYDDQKLDEWIARKSISDFLMFNTKLKDYVPNINLTGTINYLEEYKGELAEKSAEYLRKLGYPLLGSFSYSGDTILFNKKPIKGLDSREIEILKLLVDNRSHIISFERIGDTCWGNEADSKFPLRHCQNNRTNPSRL